MKTFNVGPFIYNGFMVLPNKKPTNYTAQFKEWVQDPGIALRICPDEKERLIPSCCLIGFNSNDFPLQIYKNKQLFGESSES